MSVILSLLGIVIAAAGLAAMGFGIPINEFTIGTTLIIVGMTALTGGLILIGLAAVVAELGRVAEALKARAVARPSARPAEAAEPAPATAPAMAAPPAAAAGVGVRAPLANVPGAARPRAEVPVARSPEPYPAAAPSAVDVSAIAIERLRSTTPRTERPRVEPSIVTDDGEVPLSPNGGAQHQSQQPRPSSVEPAAAEPKVTAEDRAGGASVETLKSSRLDFLFRSKPDRPATQPERFDTLWPADSRPGRSTDGAPEPQINEGPRQAEHAPPVEDREPESTQVEEPRTAAILKSGVVDGMAYTLYADGSIEAKLPHGTVRFGSIAELREHIESNS